MKNIFRKTLIAIAATVMLSTSSTASAQVFDHLGVSGGVGLNGVSVELTSNITSWVNIRAGVDYMPDIKFDADVNYYASQAGMPSDFNDYLGEAELKGALGRVQGHVIFNVYPIPKMGFYVAAGAYFGGNELVNISGRCDALANADIANFQIGNYIIPAKNGVVDGGLKVKSFRPYLGIGFGRAVPGKLLNFGIDLGVQFQGTPELYCNNGEIIELDENDPLYDQDDDNAYNKIMDYLKVYPTLTFKLNFRVF